MATAATAGAGRRRGDRPSSSVGRGIRDVRGGRVTLELAVGRAYNGSSAAAYPGAAGRETKVLPPDRENVMSTIPLDAKARFARNIKLAGEALDRRLAVARARHAVLPRLPVAANDAAPEAA